MRLVAAVGIAACASSSFDPTPSSTATTTGAAGTSGTTGSAGGAAGSSAAGSAGSRSGVSGASGSDGTGGNAGGGAGSSSTTADAGGKDITPSCGGPLNQHPFGCKFAWGVADPGGSLATFPYVQFVSHWIDASISAAGSYTSCEGCSWLASRVASTNIVPAYYAYIIGFLAHSNGIVDGNQVGTKKLTTDGAALVKSHRQAIVDAYGWYATESHKVWPTRPLVWLLEGDFVQLADKTQSNPMTFTEVGQLAADITCAIKAHMPNAVVAIDHSSWNSDDVTRNYWGAMKDVSYDLVWTTGVGNNMGFIQPDANSGSYNHATATYSFLHTFTSRPIIVDTSAGLSAARDTWSTASVADINGRIADGVIAADITGTAPTGLQQDVGRLSGVSPVPACQ